MLVVPNHHVIVPRTEDRTYYLETIITDPECRRQAQVQFVTVTNATSVQLDFKPISDQWIEIYLDGHRIVNGRYPTYHTPYTTYEQYNLAPNNTVRFSNPITGNLTIICDTLAHTKSESIIANVGGVKINFDNIQNYDVFEKRFTPSRYPMPGLGLRNTLIRIRVGDGLYCEPVVLTQPCYGYVRISKDRKSFIYTPRLGFQGWDVFGYTLLSQHGQMGKPAAMTVRTYADENRYLWSANLDGSNSYFSIRDIKHPFIGSLAGRRTSFEFYFYTRSVANNRNFTVGLFGQYRPDPKLGRFGIFLQGTSTSSDQVLVIKYTIAGMSVQGQPVYSDYRLSSRSKLSQGRWHHVVVQIDATTAAQTQITMYLDGYRQDFYNNDFTAQSVQSGDYYFLGGVNDLDTSQYLNGYISNFRVMTGSFAYSSERIEIPRRMLANTANVKMLTVSTGIQDPQSVHDASDFSRVSKYGNVNMVEVGPFSPVVLNSQFREVMQGDKFRITTQSDYICKYTRVPWTLNSNISLGSVNNGYVGANMANITVSTVSETEEIVSIGNAFTGNFIIDDIDTVEFTIDTVSMTTARRFDFYLDQWPLMIETVTVLAAPGGLVLDIAATNDGFARDKINFNHGQLVSVGAYNSSLSGYFNFNGTTDQITGSHSRCLDLTGDVTCIVWFRVMNSVAQKVRIFGKGSASNNTYALFYDTATNTFSYERDYATGNLVVMHSLVSSMLTNWYQLVGVTEGNVHKLYLNSVLVKTIAIDDQIFKTNTDGYTIGAGAGSGLHSGQVSLVSVYNKALSSQEILANFDLYRARYGL